MGVWATLNVYWAMYARDGTTASKWAQMPVVEKAFDGARQNPTKTTYVRRALVCISLRSDISTSMSNRKHGYWTFKCLPSLCLCDTRSHSNRLVVLSPSLIEDLH